MIQKKIFLLIVLVGILSLTTNVFACELTATWSSSNDATYYVSTNDSEIENEDINSNKVGIYSVSLNTTKVGIDNFFVISLVLSHGDGTDEESSVVDNVDLTLSLKDSLNQTISSDDILINNIDLEQDFINNQIQNIGVNRNETTEITIFYKNIVQNNLNLLIELSGQNIDSDYRLFETMLDLIEDSENDSEDNEINLDDAQYFKIESQESKTQNGQNNYVFEVSKNNTNGNINDLIKEHKNFTINFNFENCEDYDKVYLRLYNNWIFNILESSQNITIKTNSDNVPVALELNGDQHPKKLLFVVNNDAILEIIDDLGTSYVAEQSTINSTNVILNNSLENRFSTKILFDVPEIIVNGFAQIKIEEKEREEINIKNNKKPYGVDFIFKNITVNNESKLDFMSFSEGFEQKNSKQRRKRGRHTYNDAFLEKVLNDWYDEYSTISNFVEFFNVWKFYGINQTFKNYDGHYGGIMFIKGNEINNFGEINIDVSGGKGGYGDSPEGYGKLNAFYGGLGGDVFFIIDENMFNYSDSKLEIKLSGGDAGNGGQGRRSPGGAGGLGGSSFLLINNLESVENSKVDIKMNGGQGGDGNTERKNSSSDGCSIKLGGFGGHGGNIYFNINNISNIDSLLDVELISGSGGKGAEGRSSCAGGQGGHSGFVFIDKFNLINNQSYNIEDNNGIYFKLEVGNKGQRCDDADDDDGWFGTYGSFLDININNLQNKSNMEFLLNNKYSLQEYGDYEIKEMPLPKGATVNLNVTNGSYLPSKIKLLKKTENEDAENYMYNSKIDINSCYVNLLSLDNNFEYYSKELTINSANDYYFIDNISHPNKNDDQFFKINTSTNNNCNFCMATDLKNDIYRTDKDLYIYSKEELTDPEFKIYIKLSNNNNQLIYKNNNNIDPVFDEKLQLYKYKLSTETLKPEENGLPFWYSINNFQFEDDDRLFCYGQEYLVKIKTNGNDYTEFPFTILFEDY
jgi:hypothetical protein